MDRQIQADKAFLEWMAKMSKNVVHIADAWYAAVKWADSHHNWIPVEERLPEKEDDYLVLDCKRRVVAAFDPSDKTGWESDGNCIVSVFPTHWMEIVPPKEGGDHDK
jgi:hypothetical protein